MFVTINMKYSVKSSLSRNIFTAYSVMDLFKGTHVHLRGQMKKIMKPFIRRDKASLYCDWRVYLQSSMQTEPDFHFFRCLFRKQKLKVINCQQCYEYYT